MNTFAATLARILGRAQQPRRCAAASHSPLVEPIPPEDDDSLPRGCAWFVSSLDLRDGLAVIEHDLMVVEAALMPC